MRERAGGEGVFGGGGESGVRSQPVNDTKRSSNEWKAQKGVRAARIANSPR